MLQRVLEPEVMDSAQEAHDYDAMDHSHVNQVFVADLLSIRADFATMLDVGTGTAQIPIALGQMLPAVRVVAIDMAQHMLRVAQQNLTRAGMSERVQLQRCDAKRMPFADQAFDAVMSNSIVHHIPEPLAVFVEMARVVRPGGLIFVRDLIRPINAAALQKFVQTYAGDANAHQQQMFADSLHAALTLEEVRALVVQLGFDAASVRQTSDRHWTWAAFAPQPGRNLHSRQA